MSRPAPTPAPSVRHVDDDGPTSSREELTAKALALEATLSDIHRQGLGQGWPQGVSPKLSWALKRIERWRAGDERPVVVLVRGDRKVFAQVGSPGQIDGQVIETKAIGGGGR